MSVDFHAHTTYSDGTFGPAELVDLAREKKLSAIAITDHDITSGNDEAISRGKEIGIKVIPGIEFSANADLPGKGHLHILGLFIDPHHTHLNQTLQNLRAERSKRNQKILNRLQELGRPISLNELKVESVIGSMGRPHIAAAMVKKGYVKNYREAFQRFLMKGAAAHFEIERLNAHQVIDLIHLAGGIAIIAHPFSLGFSSFKETGEYIKQLGEIGLDGIEAYFSGQDDSFRQYLTQLAKDNDMVVSGGSDFHGSIKPEIHLGSGRDDLNIPDQVYDDLLKYWETKK